jgi:hypothetical protein
MIENKIHIMIYRFVVLMQDLVGMRKPDKKMIVIGSSMTLMLKSRIIFHLFRHKMHLLLFVFFRLSDNTWPFNFI